MVRQSYWEHLDKGIPKTRLASHPFTLYLSSRAESFHNWRHKSFGVSIISFCKEHTFFWNGHKMFVAWIMWPRIPQRTCMVNGVCKKCYSWAFSEETTQGEDSYHVYRQWNNGRMFRKILDGFAYDNRWVVPHNPTLPRCLMHILMSRCLSIFRMSNTFLNTFKKVLIVL